MTWRFIAEDHQNWNHKKQGLSMEAAALISLAVAIATQGMGAQFIAPLTQGMTFGGQTLGVMAATGFTTLTSQAAVSLISNKGNVLKTLEDLGSQSSIRSFATAVATAGLTAGLFEGLGISQMNQSLTGSLQTKLFTPEKLLASLRQSAIQTGVSTGFRVFTDKLDMREALTQGLVNVVADTTGAYLANQLGQLYTPTPVLQNGRLVQQTPQLTWGGHKFLHGLLGSFLGAASNLKDPVRGAMGGFIGGSVGESLVEELAPSLSELRRQASWGTLTQRDLEAYHLG